ncbi:trichohyalin [Xyrauchen texanus]|uniref:trichohyalin n=1 Tax=Xyrauchen texanus TaxID=154827 RepID=UPI0022421717|nr:trichohyalin [Xyrauchen texanus]
MTFSSADRLISTSLSARARSGRAQGSSCPPGVFSCSHTSTDSRDQTFIIIIFIISPAVCVLMMRLLVFWTVVCVLCAGARCLPLVDVKGTGDCTPEDASMRGNTNGPTADCEVRETDAVLNTEERHDNLLRELQELAEQEKEREQKYTRETDEYEQNDTDQEEEWDDDDDDDEEEEEEEEEDETVMKTEQNERELEELLDDEIRETETQRRQDEQLEELLKELKNKRLEKKLRKDVPLREEEEEKRKSELVLEKEKVETELKELLEEEMKDTNTWNKQKEKEEKQEELQELMKKMKHVQEEEQERNATGGEREMGPESGGETDRKELQQKREMENVSDEATQQFDREEEDDTQQKDDDDEDEELLEIEAELRKVAAELRELRMG